MTMVALNNLDITKIKRSKSTTELNALLDQYVIMDQQMRAECQRRGKPVPAVKAVK